MSVDGTPISQADLARIEAEEELHAKQRRSAVRVIAASSLDAEDCRTLLSILGLDDATVRAAHAELQPVAAATAAPKRARKRRAA
ncbi:hypothetical protein SAMN05443575_1417 [Jatrophihabitans endophyticus]|uniref:Uncharacterized protein n=1 Tax=Jatrophihabitans endophyticus TaxID=1206085 RepID=A0A1M5H7L1_9ACTN|nr:hypothetical protein [Jatrophihabitans endophyticus]SHG11702.1 hypothetical protein SAMN05443575_1417 [Jatrophihabitans endophyticus]